MEADRADRRRGRRADVRAPLVIRRIGESTGEPMKREEVTKNISLAGVYFEIEGENPYAINDAVMTSVSIPLPQTRAFPFTRVAGRSRVVRVNELSQARTGAGKRYGIALEFAEDISALTALPR